MTVNVDLDKPLDERQEDTDASLLNSADYCGLSGWYWYCEEHDAHGIADSADEAAFVMDAHVEYHELHDGMGCAEDGLDVVFHQPAGAEAPPDDEETAQPGSSSDEVLTLP